MRNPLYIAALAMMVLASASVAAQEQSLDERMALAAQSIKIDAIATLPIRSLKAVESEGKIVFMSENGRFALVGQMYDIWQKKPLDTIAQIRDAGSKLSFKGMGLDIDELNTLSMGSGKEQVVAFVDPNCPICHTLMKDAKGLTEQYTFKFVVVPALGKDSVAPTKAVACAKDRAEALTAFMGNTIKSLPTQEPCDMKRYSTTLIAADLMGINGVPLVVAPNGDISRGRPSNLSSWLKEHTL